MRRASEAVVQAAGFERYVDVFLRILLPVVCTYSRANLDVADPRSLLCGPGRRFPYAQPYNNPIRQGNHSNLDESPPCEVYNPPSVLRIDVIDRPPSQRNAIQMDLHSIRTCQEVVANL